MSAVRSPAWRPSTSGSRSTTPSACTGRWYRSSGFDILVDELARLDLVATAAIPSLDPARAPVLLGGAVVAATAVHHVGAIAVTVSEHDILDGLALSLATTAS